MLIIFLPLFTPENLFKTPEKEDIATELKTTITKEELKIENDKNLSAANDIFNKLVKNGTIRKRGYTLRGIEDYQLFRNTL